MENQLAGPSKIRKRATKACLACRARKVRCDVSQRGRPCMNCFLDGESCVVVNRASRRRKSKDDEGNSNDAAEDTGSRHLQRRESGTLGLASEQPAEDDALMDTASDAGSERPEARPTPSNGFSAINAGGGARTSDHAVAPMEFPPHARHDHPQQYHHSSSRARIQQLRWAGEQSTAFGSDITYTYYPYLAVDNLSNVPPQDISYLELQGCFRVPVKTTLDDFIKQFFLHVHPLMPLVNEGDFWELYGAQAGGTPVTEKLSLLLLQAMLFSACSYVPLSSIRALGFADMKAARAAFYRRAKLLFDFEAESCPTVIAQTALLLSSWSPRPAPNRAHTSSFWLRVSVEQARLAGAHRYKSLDPGFLSGPRHSRVFKHQNSLKRLWWCIILTDRILSLSWRRPIQVTTAQFDVHSEYDLPFDYTDLADEIERSRVYNSGTKRSLIEIFVQMVRLAVALTDLLVLAWPVNDAPVWNKELGDEDASSIMDCKSRLSSWKSAAARRLVASGGVGESADRSNGREAGFTHDSVVLYTGFLYLLYHSAMTRLCHYEHLRRTRTTRWSGLNDQTLPEKRMTDDRRELEDAASETVQQLKSLTQHRLSRWLPLNLTACVSLPLILNIIDVKLSPQVGHKLHDLHDLDTSLRGYQPQQDTMDCTSEAMREILELAQLENMDRIAVSSAGEGTVTTGTVSKGAAHPSTCFRLALCLDAGLVHMRAKETHLLTQSLLRLFSPRTLNRIKAMLVDQGAKGRRTSSAGSAGGADRLLASHTRDMFIQQRIAEWTEHDQAVSYGVQLGIVPSDLAREEGETGLPGPDRREDESIGTHELLEDVDWKHVMDMTFSETGDILEGKVLDVFAFSDQIPGIYESWQPGSAQTGGHDGGE